MYNDGKPLERIVRLIQETLKDKLETIVHSNYKIENISGRKREVDILIESVLNEIQIKIAIECKSYNKPISVEKIEAFNGKCERISGINKMIFVSKSGYQVDAINAAKDFGIELYDLKSVNAETILQWYNFIQLGLRFNVEKFNLVLDITLEEFEELKNEKAININIGQNSEERPIHDLINELVLLNKNELWIYMTFLFMKNGGSGFIDKVIQLHFKIELENAYIKSKNGNHFIASSIDSIINVWFIQKVPELIHYQAFTKLNEDIKAGYLCIESDLQNNKTEVIFTKKKIK